MPHQVTYDLSSIHFPPSIHAAISRSSIQPNHSHEVRSLLLPRHNVMIKVVGFLELGSSVRDSLRSLAVSRVSRKQESWTSRTEITDIPVLSFTRVYYHHGLSRIVTDCHGRP
eukprot:scaffold24629_cov71-Skeletonema_dohrnii-CCMP3373.AAC.4